MEGVSGSLPDVPKGAYGGYQHSYQEIADELGVSHQRVMQLERQALLKVRKGLLELGYTSDDIPWTAPTYTLVAPERGVSDE